jgi:hypothetical protein
MNSAWSKERMLDVLMRGISTGPYASAAGDGFQLRGPKSTVNREAAEAALKELLERRFDAIDLLVIYIDGMQFGQHHIISVVGVEGKVHKQVLGMQQRSDGKRGGGGGPTGTVSGAGLIRGPKVCS